MTKDKMRSMLKRVLTHVNGRGPCMCDSPFSSIAAYVKADGSHPGCNIGLQPGFREWFYWNNNIVSFIDTIDGIVDKINDCGELEVIKQLAKILGLRVSEGRIHDKRGIGFLVMLQALHDEPENWEGKRFKESAVQLVIDTFGLEMGKS